MPTTNQTKSSIARPPEELYNPHPDRSMPLLDAPNQDLSEEARETLASWAQLVTMGAAGSAGRPNAFILKPNLGEALDEVNINESVNASLEPSEAARTAGDTGITFGTFADVSEGNTEGSFTNASYGFYNVKKSDFSRSKEPIHLNEMAKGTGHTLLPMIKGKGEAAKDGEDGPADLYATPGAPAVHEPKSYADLHPIQQKLSAVLKINRFNPEAGTPYMQDHAHSTKISGMGSVQEKFGKYDADAPQVEFGALTHVGDQLLQSQVGHADDTGQGMALLPSGQQLLPQILTIGVSNLRAKNTDVGAGLTKDRTTLHSSEDSLESVGVLNSDLEPFSGGTMAKIGMATVAIPAAIAIFLIVAILGLVIDFFAKFEGMRQPAEDPFSIKSLAKGNHSPNMSSFQRDTLQIPAIDYPIDKCFNLGFGQWLGMKISKGEFSVADLLIGMLTGDVGYLLSTPGYYAIVMRRVIADTTQVAEAFGNIGFSISGILAIFDIFSTITKSMTYKFIMTMIAAGNLAAYRYRGHPRLDDTDLDSLPSTGPHRGGKSRISSTPFHSYDLYHNMAWKHSAPPSRYLIPASVMNAWAATRPKAGAVEHQLGTTISARKAGGGEKGSAASEDEAKLGYKDAGQSSWSPTELAQLSANDGRLSNEYVEFIERNLDAEYMPFYFHDLRNNQIIAFNAFLDSYSDSFSPSWTEVEGYGRADPVAIYKNTRRSVSISFTAVATSKEDFNVMWFNMNNLVSMIYPQYSRGKMMVTADNKDNFIMPFSQLQTASPIIRMRVGDLFSSNYSEIMGLGRSFGVGLPAEKSEFDFKARQEAITAAEDKIAAKLQNPGDKNTVFGGGPDGLGYAEGDKVHLTGRGSLIARKDDGTFLMFQDEAYKGRGAEPVMKQKKFPVDSKMKFEITKTGRADKAFLELMKGAGDSMSLFYVVKPDAETATDLFPKAKDVHFVITHEQINGLTKEDFDKMYSGIADAGLDKKMLIKDPKDFLDPKKNAIVRAFNTTKGKGMAGYITSLSMDWTDATWEIDYGHRAPKLIKLSVSFSPIHDTPLGLTHDGGLRGVAYNVGSASRLYAGNPYASAAVDENEAERDDLKVIGVLKGGKFTARGAGEDPDGGLF